MNPLPGALTLELLEELLRGGLVDKGLGHVF